MKMNRRMFRLRANKILQQQKEVLKVDDVVVVKDKSSDKVPEPPVKSNPQSKNVYAFIGKKCVGVYDSITLCANALGMTRAMVKKAIDNGTHLENGQVLKLNK